MNAPSTFRYECPLCRGTHYPVPCPGHARGERLVGPRPDDCCCSWSKDRLWSINMLCPSAHDGLALLVVPLRFSRT